jgi:dolichol-phosphate mannosyltransferase
MSSGDAVVVIDADMQDPPELLGDMIARWREASTSSTASALREGETFAKRIIARSATA